MSRSGSSPDWLPMGRLPSGLAFLTVDELHAPARVNGRASAYPAQRELLPVLWLAAALGDATGNQGTGDKAPPECRINGHDRLRRSLSMRWWTLPVHSRITLFFVCGRPHPEMKRFRMRRLGCPSQANKSLYHQQMIVSRDNVKLE